VRDDVQSHDNGRRHEREPDGTHRLADLGGAASGRRVVVDLVVPLGALLALGNLPGRRLIAALVNTGMGLPPVVVGLGVSILLWRSGPLGGLALLSLNAWLSSRTVLRAPPALTLRESV